MAETVTIDGQKFLRVPLPSVLQWDVGFTTRAEIEFRTRWLIILTKESVIAVRHRPLGNARKQEDVPGLLRRRQGSRGPPQGQAGR